MNQFANFLTSTSALVGAVMTLTYTAGYARGRYEAEQSRKRASLKDQIVKRRPSEPDVVCVICLDELDRESKTIELKELPCSHTYHSNCINEWFKVSALCPACRCAVISL